MIFEIVPIPKPRMVRSDSWRKRDCVVRYWMFKDELVRQAKTKGFVLGDQFKIEFHLPLPPSWSKKKLLMYGLKPHQQKPDIDNLVKSVMDSLLEQDCMVWKIEASKFWSKEGRIVIENI